MNATIHNILQKTKQDPTGFVSINDFQTAAGEPFNAQQILQDPTISLYCLQHQAKQVVFVQTAPDIDLTQYPFFYQAQFEQATRLITIPYIILHQLAAQAAQTEPANKKLLLIYSVGRCGSTLLSQVFDHVEGILSLSEPDFFTNILLNRNLDGSNDVELMNILRSGIQLLMKPLSNRQPDSWVIKFRSSGFEIADLIHKAYPTAKNIFLYRDAIKRTRSEARAFNLFTVKPVKMNNQMLQRWLHLIPLIENYKRKAKWGRLSRIEMSALAWLSRMDRYLTLHEQGVPMCAIRYEDMITRSEAIIEALFSFCDISSDYVPQTLHVFDRDSQAGTSLSRSKIDTSPTNELTAQHIKQIHKILRKHPVIKTADYILPETAV